MRVTTTDSDGDWLVTIGPHGVITTEGGRADATVSGPSSDLYLMLWNRRGTDDLQIDGDRSVIDLFRDRVHVRWS
jgi:predicted lipid carrier protein YhbT